MKKLILSFFLIVIPSVGLLFAQSITITPNGTGAAIEANSTTKGFLPPRMTMAQRSNLTTTDGLMIYCTDCVPAGHYAFSGNTWKPMFDYLTSTGSCATYTVGQQAQGGTVIWVDDSGQHGLVAAPEDMSRPDVTPIGTFTLDVFPWAVNISISNTTYTMAQSHGVFGGQKNSEKIVEQFGWAEYAAFLCTQRNWSGYGDWYLPSIGELVILYSNRNLLPTPLKTSSPNLPQPYSDYYWSSTEAAGNTAFVVKVAPWIPSVPAGSIGAVLKGLDRWSLSTPQQETYYVHVRAVRRF
jgi:hypothetical protein